MLLDRALVTPKRPRSAPARPISVLGTITLVLERSDRPMRTIEIHATGEQLVWTPLIWTSVKPALAAGASGDKPRYGRLRRGVYAIARQEWLE